MTRTETERSGSEAGTEPSTATATAPPPSTAAPAPPTARGSSDVEVREPASRAVVLAYYAAINAGDYRAAWNMGGSRFASSYESYAAGFEGLAEDKVTVLESDGGSVDVALEAVQTDGTSRWFRGTYTVSDDRITGANIREAERAGPDAPGGAAYFKSCGDAHDRGAGPFRAGEPGYRPQLDRDDDGTACEWN
ncbi:excalibur calcium-binding domain-containing protein [Streptomyces sp. H27-D2]|uniref:excalibur calcium-binding domain-containing protein n=1 Tax=Streptomyces sp. H27-D2 TaxID=3046304 RepID=UPI002DBE95C8|nr:excalibur calcium-binding domain-containing protein [Streptomyces sp. H27-D2]MEC4016487.1 excalibur calcium-binding domain-containing protein [Streptomyces sp. H27-D2]